MFDQLVCTLCQNNLKKLDQKLICQKCHTSFSIKQGIPIMWKENFTNNSLSNKMIADENRFSQTLTSSIQKKSGPDKNAQHFYLRSTENSYAGKIFDQRAFSPLFVMSPEIINKLSTFKILNVGCGLGKDADWLLKNGAKDIVCTDVSFEFVEFTKNRFKNRKIQPSYYFQANAENLPVLNNSFDLIFVSSVIHHVPHPLLFLKKAAQISPIFIATLESSDMGIVGKLLKPFFNGIEYGGLKTHRLNPNKIKRYLEKEGNRVKIKTDFAFFPFTIFKSFVNNKLFVDSYFIWLSLVNLFISRFGHNFTLVATRLESSER